MDVECFVADPPAYSYSYPLEHASYAHERRGRLLSSGLFVLLGVKDVLRARMGRSGPLERACARFVQVSVFF